MGWFARLKIADKLGVMVASVILVFSLLAGIMLWQTVSEIMEQDLEARGRSIAGEMAAMSSDPIQTGNLLALDELIYMAKKSNSFVEYIFIVDPEQQVMAHTFHNGMPKNLLELHPPAEGEGRKADVMAFSSDRGHIQDILQPIEDGSLGYVRIGLNNKALRILLENKFFMLVFITLLVGLLGALFVFRLTRVFTKPLVKLMCRAEIISRGEFAEPPLHVRSKDEFGRLTEAMNTMAEHLHMGEMERKRLLGHLLTVQEDERKRISMELHDESGQALTALMFSMRALAKQTKDAETRAYILAVRDEAAHILQKLRSLAVELRPPALDELGIEAAVKNLVTNYQRYHALRMDFSCQLHGMPDDAASLAIYRIIQECLTNIVKHAEADRVLILLESQEDSLRLVIKDNGIGITQAAIEEARRTNHLGIYGIQERIRILGGSMKIYDERPAWATVYEIVLKTEMKEGQAFD